MNVTDTQVKAAALLALVAIGGVAALAWAQRPVNWPVVKVEGVDAYAAHQPFFAERTIHQEFLPISEKISEIDVLIVDFKRRSPTAPITLELFNANGERLRSVTVPGTAVRDDFYLPFAFTPLPVAPGASYSFTLAAPAAAHTAPYAVRWSLNGHDIAFAYSEPKNNWFTLQYWTVRHAQKLQTLLGILLATVAVALLLPWANRSRRASHTAMAIVVITGALLQYSVARQLAGSPGGDDYYYLVAAEQLSRGQNPLSDWSYRLPFYPLLLVPAVSKQIPDLLWGRLLGIAFTVVLGYGLLLLARALRLKPAVAVAAMALLYINTDWLITSVRPRPYHLFSVELLLATATLFFIKTKTQAALWGILLGVMGMTRQEAYVPIAVLGLAFIGRLMAERRSWRAILTRAVAAGLPLVLIISPYFYANWRDTGNPFSTAAYTSRSDLFWPATWHDFWHGNLVAARSTLGAVWLPSSQAGVKIGAAPLYLGVLAALVLLSLWRPAQHHPLRTPLTVLFGLVFFSAASAWLLRAGDSWQQELNIVIIAAVTLGPLMLWRSGRAPALIVLAVLASQLLIATLFHPAAKHYQQTYPLLALGAAAVLLAAGGMSPELKKLLPVHHWQQSLHLIAPLLAISWLGAGSLLARNNAIDDHNYQAAAYYVTTAAAEGLERYGVGNVAAEVDYDRGDGMYRLHSYQQRAFIRYDTARSREEERAWLCEQKIKYVIDHDDLPHIDVRSRPDFARFFTLLFEKKARGRDDHSFKVTAFVVDQARLCE